MPSQDITKCVNENCSRKEQCLRFTLEGKLLGQSYAFFRPVKDDETGFECEDLLSSWYDGEFLKLLNQNKKT